MRYAVGDLIDDLKDDRPLREKLSILYDFYQTIGELRLRLSGQFVGMGKHLARKLQACDPVFAQQLETVMTKAHMSDISAADIEILSSLLQTCGGSIFDGYKQDAPPEMRATPKWLGDASEALASRANRNVPHA
jgi:hypothetical protein